MKSTKHTPAKKTALVVDAKTRAEFVEDMFGPLKTTKKPAASKPLTLADVQRGASIFDRYFSIEQQAQINRLQSAGDFEGETESEAIGKTIATLAAAGLYVLGLDPLSEQALSRLGEVVYGAESGFSAEIFNSINDQWQTADIWTLRQRAAELGEASCSVKAEEARA
jgi:hypothetical protein